jgi:signal transduction histidine kinase
MNQLAAGRRDAAPPLLLNVDDNEAARYAKSRILRVAGYRVAEAATGQEALHAVDTLSPSLVLLDVKLPDIDGFEVCRRIKDRHAGTMVLQTSATFRDGASRIRGLDGGADSYLAQPVEPEELLAVVRALMRLRTAEEALRDANATLETRVAERTAELEAALVRLEAQMAERRQAEAVLAQAQKMEALGGLTSGVAHDFNNLLQAVASGATLIARRTEDAAKVRDLAAMIRQAAERGTVLTSRLLAFARRQDLAPASVDAAALVRGMVDLLERTLGAGVRIVAEDFPEGLWPLRADANQLELALINLAVNARDAMPDGGTLTLGGENRSIAAGRPPAAAPPGLPPGDYVVVTVADTGTGMDAATLARAAEPFFTTKGPGKGTGLGLSMVHGLAEQLHGRLHLHSTPGAGTRAELWLPRADPAERSATVPARRARAAPPRSPPLRVLLVDDDPLVLRSATALLADLGHHVTGAASGDAALAALQDGLQVDVLLSDFAMPGMSGLELLSRARQLRPQLPAALATAYAELPHGVQPKAPMLRKPYEQADLAALLATLQDTAASG